MANIENPPLSSPLVDKETGRITTAWAGWFTRLYSRVGSATGGLAPSNAKYITQTADSTLSAEQALSLLSTGFLKVTTGSGVVSSQTQMAYADIQNVSATDKVLGRSTAGAGATEEISCPAAGREVLASSLSWGTFTPTVTLVGGAGNTVPVYSTNSGRYAQVGKNIFVDVYLTGDGGAEGAGTGVLTVALPVAASGSQSTGKFIIGYGLNNTLESVLTATIAASASVTSLSYFNAIGTTASYTGAEQNNSTRTIRLKFHYEAA